MPRRGVCCQGSLTGRTARALVYPRSTPAPDTTARTKTLRKCVFWGMGCLVLCLAVGNPALPEEFTQRHSTARSAADAALILAKALNRSAVTFQMNKKVNAKTDQITKLLTQNSQPGLLLEARVYKQKYGFARIFWSANIIGTGSTDLTVLTEHAMTTKPTITGSPGLNWEFDPTATKYYWYVLGEDGKLERTSVATTLLVNRVSRIVKEASKRNTVDSESVLEERVKETEQEMERMFQVRTNRVEESSAEIAYWLEIKGYTSIVEWSERGYSDSRRRDRILRHAIQSRQRSSGDVSDFPGSDFPGRSPTAPTGSLHPVVPLELNYQFYYDDTPQ